MLGSPILNMKDMRILMFQLSGFYSKAQLARFGGFRVLGFGFGVPSRPPLGSVKINT